MHLKFIAISDTHLGAEHSILSYIPGVDHLWESLRAQFGLSSNEVLEVDELVLLGDIVDRTVSSLNRVQAQMRTFLDGLNGRISSRKLVYVPGNHDHTIWTNYRESKYGPGSPYGITTPHGEPVLKKGKICQVATGAKELVSAVLGYPDAAIWQKINGCVAPDVVWANPLYAKHTGDRTYVFAHGTHFRHEFTLPKWLLELIKKFFQLEQRIEMGGGLSKIHPLEELERLVSPIVDAVWPEAKFDHYRKRTRIYYFLSTLRSKLLGLRPIPEDSQLYPREGLENAPEARINRLTSDGKVRDGGIRRWKKHFLPHVLSYLRLNSIPQNNMTFVYGDSHHGGWGELPMESDRIRVYNCGSWVVYNPIDHPACHVFAVDQNNEEYLVDLSFKGVKVGEKMLLEAATGSNVSIRSAANSLLTLLLKIS